MVKIPDIHLALTENDNGQNFKAHILNMWQAVLGFLHQIAQKYGHCCLHWLLWDLICQSSSLSLKIDLYSHL